ncbi:hypothetical protein JOS77_09190 [Chromobacterium haemolyticum]|nr:hypothetical protein JOS77_09190 [Chromobacterium haemolyticum]
MRLSSCDSETLPSKDINCPSSSVSLPAPSSSSLALAVGWVSGGVFRSPRGLAAPASSLTRIVNSACADFCAASTNFSLAWVLPESAFASSALPRLKP